MPQYAGPYCLGFVGIAAAPHERVVLLIAGVNKLPPGSIGTFDGKSFSVTPYWEPVLPKEKQAKDDAEALDELERRIEIAVSGYDGSADLR